MHSLLSAAPLMLALLATPPPSLATETCIEDWSQAARIVKAEGLAPVETVTRLAVAHVSGTVIKVTLCQDGSRYVYRLVLRGAANRHSAVTVDAKQPFAR